MLHERKLKFTGGGSKRTRTDSEPILAPTAPRVGADLRAARERLAWTVQDVAGELRIRDLYLVALEEGQIEELPGTAYAVGFLRTYAAALGLDPEELTRRFRDEAAAVNRKIELIFPAPVPERGVPAGAVVLLGVVLAIGAYIGWYRLSGDGALPPEVVAPVPARLAPLAEQAVPPSTSALSAAPATPATASGAPAGAKADVTAPMTTDSTAALEPVQSVPPSQAAAATTMPPLTAAQIPAATDQPRIVLSANADAWLLVRDKSGQVLLNRVLHPGESWSVPLMPNLTLTTGNAGGTSILVDGAAAPALGADGAVRRDIPLDPDLLKSGKLGALAQPIVTASSGAAVAPKAAAQ